MPAKHGGGPRKGRAGKKAQTERMVETAKQAQPTTNPRPSPIKPGTRPKPAQKSASSDQKSLANSVTVNHVVSGKQPVAQSIKKIITVRLPCQTSATIAKKVPMLYTKPVPATMVMPKPFNSPNKVVARLPTMKPSKEPVSFLSIPAEIRNIIYNLVMPARKYRIHFIRESSKHSGELTYSTSLNGYMTGPRLSAADGRRRRLFDLPKRLYISTWMPRYSLSPGPAALLLSCKRISEEATPILYGRTVFSFQAMRPLRTFLGNLRPDTRKMIRSLELIHHTAGNPKQTKDDIWKAIYDKIWHNLCFQIRDQCTGLNALALDLTINDIPFRRGPLANWMSPLYAFMNLDRLKKLRIQLHQFHTDEAVLLVEAYEIRKELMGANYYEPPTSSRDVSAENSPAKIRPAVGTLRITGNMHDLSPPRPAKTPKNRYAGMTMEQCMKLPTHLLPNQLPSSDPRATVFWSPDSPVEKDDHPAYHERGSPGEKAAVRKMQLKHKKERLEKKELAQAAKMKKSKGKGKEKF